MNINKKRLLCVVMALAVILSCVAMPNKVEARTINRIIGFKSKGILKTNTPGISTETYYLDGVVNCGVDHITITLYKKEGYKYEDYRFDTINIKTTGPTDLATNPDFSPKISAVLSENMWGDYICELEIFDMYGYSNTYNYWYSIDKNLGSYMSGLYKKLLMRDPDLKGYVNNMQMVSNRNITIEGMVRAFYDGPEYQNKRFKPTNEVFVESMYRGILGRKPDTQGYNNYVRALKNGKDRRTVLNEFLGSKEFKQSVVRDFKLDYHE